MLDIYIEEPSLKNLVEKKPSNVRSHIDMWWQVLINSNCVRVVREWRYLFLSYSFSEEWLFLLVISFVSKEWPVSILGCFLSCWFCSTLTLIIHLYEWMLLSIILCQKDLDFGGYLCFRISTFTSTLFSKLIFFSRFHIMIVQCCLSLLFIPVSYVRDVKQHLSFAAEAVFVFFGGRSHYDFSRKKGFNAPQATN